MCTFSFLQSMWNGLDIYCKFAFWTRLLLLWNHAPEITWGSILSPGPQMMRPESRFSSRCSPKASTSETYLNAHGSWSSSRPARPAQPSPHWFAVCKCRLTLPARVTLQNAMPAVVRVLSSDDLTHRKPGSDLFLPHKALLCTCRLLFSTVPVILLPYAYSPKSFHP